MEFPASSSSSRDRSLPREGYSPEELSCPVLHRFLMTSDLRGHMMSCDESYDVAMGSHDVM